MGILLELLLHPAGQTSRHPFLRGFLSTPNPNWAGIINAFQKTTLDLQSARAFRLLSRTNLLTALQISYMGLPWNEFSIDLVAATLRQREFSLKITSNELKGMVSPIVFANAIDRYHKFLILIKRNVSSKTKFILVPTLDIDLCWHTHQLDAVEYRNWCIQHLNVAVNHNDTAGKESLENGLRETSQAWYEAYREHYLNDNAPHSPTSKSQKRSSFILPFKKKKEEKSNQNNGASQDHKH
jgi:Glycine-rich domain-containing protein-like